MKPLNVILVVAAAIVVAAFHQPVNTCQPEKCGTVTKTVISTQQNIYNIPWVIYNMPWADPAIVPKKEGC